jgi:hypothetical protein
VIKKMFVSAALALASLGLGACSNGGTVVRTPEQFRTDMTASVQTKIPELRACYDSSRKAGDVKGKATLHVEIQTFFGDKSGVLFAPGELPDPKVHGSTSVAKTDGSSKQLNLCVHDVLTNVSITPLDKKYGIGQWTLVFDPNSPDTTLAPSAPPAPPAATP